MFSGVVRRCWSRQYRRESDHFLLRGSFPIHFTPRRCKKTSRPTTSHQHLSSDSRSVDEAVRLVRFTGGPATHGRNVELTTSQIWEGIVMKAQGTFFTYSSLALAMAASAYLGGAANAESMKAHGHRLAEKRGRECGFHRSDAAPSSKASGRVKPCGSWSPRESLEPRTSRPLSHRRHGFYGVTIGRCRHRGNTH